MTWQDKLLEEAQHIVTHGEGKLEFHANIRSGNKVDIRIEAGKTYRYLIDRILED